MFGTDNGPPCNVSGGQCGGTIYAYSLKGDFGRFSVDVLCMGCHARRVFNLPSGASLGEGAIGFRREHARALAERRLLWYGAAPWDRKAAA